MMGINVTSHDKVMLHLPADQVQREFGNIRQLRATWHALFVQSIVIEMTIFAYLPLAIEEEEEQLRRSEEAETIYVSPDHHTLERVRRASMEPLDIQPDVDVDGELLRPKSILDEKNIFFFRHTGYSNLRPSAKRNIRNWHRQLAGQGWVVRVLDSQPGSALNISGFLDITDINSFPEAFLNGSLSGERAAQHLPRLIIWPLLLRFGGIFADVGMPPIENMNRIWMNTLGDAQSPYQLLTYRVGLTERTNPANQFLASTRNNELLSRCQSLLLRLWMEDGDTDGLYDSPSRIQSFERVDGGSSPRGTNQMATIQPIHVRVMSTMMDLVEDDYGWNGPQYVEDHVYIFNL